MRTAPTIPMLGMATWDPCGVSYSKVLRELRMSYSGEETFSITIFDGSRPPTGGIDPLVSTKSVFSDSSFRKELRQKVIHWAKDAITPT